jgi:septal ring-binding cell division protein DamX
MLSRTPEGKHTKRFIVLKKSESNGDTKYVRSVVVSGFFPTKEEAQAAVEARGSKLEGTTYKVRQK